MDVIITTNQKGDQPHQCSLADFICANLDSIGRPEIETIVDTISNGDEYRLGGGAAPVFTIRRA